MIFFLVACNTLIRSLLVSLIVIGAHAGKYIDWHRNYGVGGLYETVFHPTNDVKKLLISTNSSLQETSTVDKTAILAIALYIYFFIFL